MLTTDAVTVTTDHMGRLYAVIPDDVAHPLAITARKGIDPQAHGMLFESAPHPADSWAATTVRTIFEAVLSSPLAQDDDHAWGLDLYPKYGGGTFYGAIVGESRWNPDTRWWRDYEQTRDLRVRGSASIVATNRPALAGTCTF
ncbi:hypothetical protein OG613_46960 (plasmid) [Streptomyces sp. NBC_00015]|uniref:hypothetical protein n=1 Tax=Streptomyces sp. NBC_00015 TaxID=2903611 RepID=UPI002F90D86D